MPFIFNPITGVLDIGNITSGPIGPFLEKIDGDSGSITGAEVTIYADQAALGAGETVEFVNSGTVSTLKVSDSNGNTIVGSGSGSLTNSTDGFNTIFGFQAGSSLSSGMGGNNLFGWKSGNAITTGNNNTAQGQSSLLILQSGMQNNAHGNNSLSALISGSFNNAYGYASGSSFTGSESSNIVIGNAGTVGDNNTIRIGSQGSGNGQHNKCFIAGITGVTPASSNFATINSAGQLGDSGTSISTGSFTPTISGSSSAGTTSYISQSGSYVKIGNIVFVSGTVSYSAATGTGSLQIASLPFTINAGVFCTGSVVTTGLTFPVGSTSLSILGSGGNTLVNIFASGTGITGGNIQMANTTVSIYFDFFYLV